MSLQTANVISHVMAKTKVWSPEVIASALAFLCGVICFGIGVLRLGWIVEFIPTPAVSGFMTGSAFTIAAGQVPKLMGISNVNTNGTPTYLVIINTLKGLGRTKVDAAFGLVGLFFLYAIRSFCVHLPRRYPKYARACFFISVFRSAFVIIILTIAARVWVGGKYGYDTKKYPISLLKHVPRGFQHIGQPELSPQIFADLGSELPVSVIVLLLEHIAIAKSFGRLNNYKINPNQELIAIGVTNLIGPCFGAYAATGSFSRSAVKAKSGVRTPLAGWITAILVLIAIYALTGVFYWIPNAGLSAIIIHAVGDLIASPRILYKFWLISPLELFIWLAAVLVSVFSSLENGVYTSVGASVALLLIRIAHPRGRWLGTVRIHHGDSPESTQIDHREVFVPLDDKDGLRDPSIQVVPPPPGVLIYRFEEAFTYPNASSRADHIIDHAKQETRPSHNKVILKAGDRPWNDPGPINPWLGKIVRPFTFGNAKRSLDAKLQVAQGVAEVEHDPRPVLRAFVFDFSGVSNVDTTSIQTLVDVRLALERYTGAPIEFHFANILSPWIRRALLAGGFGTGSSLGHVTEVAPVVPGRNGEAELRALRQIQDHTRKRHAEQRADAKGDDDHIEAAHTLPESPDYDEENKGSAASSTNKERLAEEGYGDDDARSAASVPVLWGSDLTPLFHLDLSAALAAATYAARR